MSKRCFGPVHTFILAFHLVFVGGICTHTRRAVAILDPENRSKIEGMGYPDNH